MIPKSFENALLKHFSYTPTKGQENLISLLGRFVLAKDNNPLFLIKGYAGTGKTTIISALVNALPAAGLNSVLMAPTGRAAKVLSAYSGRSAFTIHRKIYYAKHSSDGGFTLALQKNNHKNTIFLVDEASMIQGESGQTELGLFSKRNLLEDLISYVFSGKNCKLLLIGDAAQLPPVGINMSPALDLKFLEAGFHLSATDYELNEVVRQAFDSGILANATLIRGHINDPCHKFPLFDLSNINDVRRIGGWEMEEYFQWAFSDANIENSVVICRSNKRANAFNREIRNRILLRENEISAGDLLMVVKNNYYWLSEDSAAGFIANGDTIEVLRVSKTEELYGLRFANITVRLCDYPDEKEIEVKIILDVLHAETPALTFQENQRLFHVVLEDYAFIPNKYKRMKEVRGNPYYNAIQVKYACALTCHKTQGGQWENVFIDQGFIKEDMITPEYKRWLYTAVTRATKSLFLMNFNENFFAD